MFCVIRQAYYLYRDFWLYVVNFPGSHVVVRNPDRLAALPPAVLTRAARLAAWHSKARGSRGKVEVHLCRAADVSQPPDFPPARYVCAAGTASKSTRLSRPKDQMVADE